MFLITYVTLVLHCIYLDLFSKYPYLTYMYYDDDVYVRIN